MHSLAIALHQHLTYTCCASEVAINLEWWVSIERDLDRFLLKGDSSDCCNCPDVHAEVNFLIIEYDLSALCRRAHKLMRHPVLQPVEKSPFISRVLAAAAAKTGVLSNEI